MRLLNIGSLNLDYTDQVEHFVRPGETLSVLSQSVGMGGKGLNQSAAAALAGAEVWHAGCVGVGGEILVRSLEDVGVNTQYIRRVQELQGSAVIQVNQQGENCILLYGGSNRAVTAEDVCGALDHFGPEDLVLLQNEISAMEVILAECARRGIPVMLNPSPFERTLLDMDLSEVRWLLVNEVELSDFTGTQEAQLAWERVHARCPQMNLLITWGDQGSEAFLAGGEHLRQEACRVSAVDTTGAGDTFTGYFAAGLAGGRSVASSLRLASAAAALSVTGRGAYASIPQLRQVEAFLAAREKDGEGALCW